MLNENMETKICSKCKIEKRRDEFLWKNKSKNLKYSVCSDCYKEVRKKHYDTNREYYKNKTKNRRKDHSIKYEELKKTLSCVVCSENESVCLDFHHLDPSSKEYSLGSRKHSSQSFEQTKKEIEKCVVLCANCHRKLHFGIIILS